MVESLEKSLFDVVGDPKKVVSEIERFKGNVRYFETNYSALVKQFPNEWVAIFNQSIILHDRSYIRVLKSLRGLGVNTGHAYVQFLETKQRTQILQEAVLSLPIGI